MWHKWQYYEQNLDRNTAKTAVKSYFTNIIKQTEIKWLRTCLHIIQGKHQKKITQLKLDIHNTDEIEGHTSRLAWNALVMTLS